MSYNKLEPKYAAVLKTMDDKLIETGTMSISPESQGVDFKSDFVPLYKRGERLRIVRMQDGVEVIRYTGEVYLSAQNMLRIVSVTEEILPGAKFAFSYQVSISCQAQAEFLEKNERHFPFFHKKPTRRISSFPIQINTLSLKQIRFVSSQKLEQGQQVSLSISQPKLTNLKLSVIQIVDFGQNSYGYKCSISRIDPASYSQLESYIALLSEQQDSSLPSD